jgi:3-deoxy-manno-octulosonate cytidylyltransferase (CMP-KDO synthetase)
MKQNKKIVCIIPARLESTRFPRKILSVLCGKPLLAWIWQAAKRVALFDEVWFAIDSQETASVIQNFGGSFILTSPVCQSGTDRLVELATQNKIQADVWVNWQGDEPFVNEAMIETLLQAIDQPSQQIWTLKKCIEHSHEITSPKVAKVVCDKQGNALYFSRAPIPFFRDEQDLQVLATKHVYFKHVGLYAYTTAALHAIATLGTSILEDAEKLEQLRFLDYNLRIKVHETTHDVFGIDTPEDLRRAEQEMRRRLDSLSETAMY